MEMKKLTLNERKPIFGDTPTHFPLNHDYGRKGSYPRTHPATSPDRKPQPERRLRKQFLGAELGTGFSGMPRGGMVLGEKMHKNENFMPPFFF